MRVGIDDGDGGKRNHSTINTGRGGNWEKKMNEESTVQSGGGKRRRAPGESLQKYSERSAAIVNCVLCIVYCLTAARKDNCNAKAKEQ